jgi:hypothetical protein
MHSRRQQPVRRVSQKKNQSRIITWGVMVLLFLAVFKMVSHYLDTRMRALPGNAMSSPPHTPPESYAAQPKVLIQQQAATLRSAPDAPTPNPPVLVKCLVDGRTLYTHGQCPTNAKHVSAPQLVASATPNTAAAFAPLPSGPKEESPEAVSARLRAKAAKEQAEYEAQLAREAALYQQAALECAGLADEVKRLDSLARYPGHPSQQDWVREKKRSVQARMFSLRCSEVG